MGNCLKKSRRQVLPSISGGARTSYKTEINDSKLSLRAEDEIKPEETKTDIDFKVIEEYPDCVLVSICSHLLLDEVKPKEHINTTHIFEVKPKENTNASKYIEVKPNSLIDSQKHIEVQRKVLLENPEIKSNAHNNISEAREVKPTDQKDEPKPLMKSDLTSPFHASNESIYDKFTEIVGEVADEINEQEEDDQNNLPNTVRSSVKEDKRETGRVGSGKVQLDMDEVEKGIKRMYVLKRSKSNTKHRNATDDNDDAATNCFTDSENTDYNVVSVDDRIVLGDITDNSECSHDTDITITDSSTISVKGKLTTDNEAPHFKNDNETPGPPEDCLVSGEADELGTPILNGVLSTAAAEPLKDERISPTTPTINEGISVIDTRDEKVTLKGTITADQQQRNASCQERDILERQVSLSKCKSVSSATMSLIIESVSQNNSRERKTYRDGSLQSDISSKYISHDVNSQKERIDTYRGNKESDQFDHLSTHKDDYLSDKPRIEAISTAKNMQGTCTNEDIKSVTQHNKRVGIEHEQIPGTSMDTTKSVLKAAQSDNLLPAVGESNNLNFSKHEYDNSIESIQAKRRTSVCIDFETKRQVSRTYKQSLELIKNHDSKSDCEFGVYVSATPGESTPRLVQVRASSKQIKDGDARYFIKMMKNFSASLTYFDPFSEDQKTTKKHLNTASKLIDSHIEVHWREKKGPTTNPQLTTVPVFYKPAPQKKRLREWLGTEKLQKYGITPQCKAIENIKLDENEFPAIVPPRIRKKFMERKNENLFMN